MPHETSYAVQLVSGTGAAVLAEYARRGFPIERIDPLPAFSAFLETDTYLLWVPVDRDYEGLANDLYLDNDPRVLIAEGGVLFFYNGFLDQPPFSLLPGPPLKPLSYAGLALQRLPLRQWQQLGLANAFVARQIISRSIAAISPEARVFGATGLSLGSVASEGEFQAQGGLDEILDAIGAKDAWRSNMGEQGVIVVLDSGVDGSVIPESNKAGGWTNIPGGTPWNDQVGHGSMVARLAISVAPRARIYSVRPAPDDNGLLSSGNLYLAGDHILAWALEQRSANPHQHIIVNNSWGVTSCIPLFIPGDTLATRVFTKVDQAQVGMVTWAAGNSRHICGDTVVSVYTLASMVPSLAVGALDRNHRIQFYSARGPGAIFPWAPAVVCPTFGILPWGTAYRDFGEQGGGTSSCAPMVSGALAILMTESPTTTHRLHRAAIRAGADNGAVGKPGILYDPYTGSGLLRIDRSLIALRSGRAQLQPSYALESIRW